MQRCCVCSYGCRVCIKPEYNFMMFTAGEYQISWIWNLDDLGASQSQPCYPKAASYKKYMRGAFVKVYRGLYAEYLRNNKNLALSTINEIWNKYFKSKIDVGYSKSDRIIYFWGSSAIFRIHVLQLLLDYSIWRVLFLTTYLWLNFDYLIYDVKH